MALKDIASATNIMFLLAAIYFIVVAVSGEGTVYAVVIGVVSLVAIALSIRRNFSISAAWRVATAVFCLAMFAVQIGANVNSPSFFSAYTVISTVINGAFLIMFVGVMLSTLKPIVRKPEETEEVKTEEKKPKKLSYQI